MVVGHSQAVNKQTVIISAKVVITVHQLSDFHKFAVTVHQAGITALDENVKLCAQFTPIRNDDVGKQGKLCAFGKSVDGVDDVISGVLFHHFA